MTDPLTRKEFRDTYRVGAHNVIDVVRDELRLARSEAKTSAANGDHWKATAALEAVARLERVLMKVGVKP